MTPSQGRLLNLIARIHGARRILEIGTLGGYSTIWLARALPTDGRLVTLELNPAYAAVAAANVAAAGLADRVELRVGPASELLADLRERGRRAVRPGRSSTPTRRSTPEYFVAALELMAPGRRDRRRQRRAGAARSPIRTAEDEGAQGMRRFHQLAAAEPRVEGTTIQTVGAKGYDGFTLLLIARRRAEA